MIMSNYIVHPLSRAKHIKALAHVSLKEDEDTKSPGALPVIKNESCERILEKVWFTLHKLTCSFICLYLSKISFLIKLRRKIKAEDVELLEQLFVLEGIFFDPNSLDEVEAAYEDVTSRTISSLQKAVEELIATVEKVTSTNFQILLFTWLPL